MEDYVRVIPRDLFNEANLLKCYGRLAIVLGETDGHAAGFEEDQVDRFEIVQDTSSGSIRIANLTFLVNGARYRLERSLNARDEWPLSLESDDDRDFESIEVFDAQGDLSEDMLRFIGVDPTSGTTEPGAQS